jgi:hypothetical protein
MIHTGFKQQNHIRGPPLQLRPEEVTLLLEQGVLCTVACRYHRGLAVMCVALRTCLRSRAGVIRLSGIKVEAPGGLRRKRALPDSSDDESIPEDWIGCNFTPSWQTAVERQEPLTVVDVHGATTSLHASWNYPESHTEWQYYTVFKDLHEKGCGISLAA